MLIGAFVIPALILLGSLLVRILERHQFPPSAAADWLLLLAVFDVAVIRELAVFSILIPNDWLRAHAADVFWVVVILNPIFWYVSAVWLEPQLARRKSQSPWYRKTIVLLGSLVVIIGMTGFHISIFLVRN